MSNLEVAAEERLSRLSSGTATAQLRRFWRPDLPPSIGGLETKRSLLAGLPAFMPTPNQLPPVSLAYLVMTSRHGDNDRIFWFKSFSRPFDSTCRDLGIQLAVLAWCS